MNFKHFVGRNAVPITLIAAAIGFLSGYGVTTKLAGWTMMPALGVSVLMFIMVGGGVFAIATNIVSAYTLEAAMYEQQVIGFINRMRSFSRSIKNVSFRKEVEHSGELILTLIERTREGQPNNLYSCVLLLAKWLDETALKILPQYLDMQDHPEFQDNARDRMQKAEQAFETFNQGFLIANIKLIESGQNMAFDVAVQMMEASKHDRV